MYRGLHVCNCRFVFTLEKKSLLGWLVLFLDDSKEKGKPDNCWAGSPMDGRWQDKPHQRMIINHIFSPQKRSLCNHHLIWDQVLSALASPESLKKKKTGLALFNREELLIIICKSINSKCFVNSHVCDNTQVQKHVPKRRVFSVVSLPVKSVVYRRSLRTHISLAALTSFFFGTSMMIFLGTSCCELHCLTSSNITQEMWNACIRCQTFRSIQGNVTLTQVHLETGKGRKCKR